MRILVFAIVAALVTSVSAQAPFDFTLGGYKAHGRGDGERDGNGAWLNLRHSLNKVHGVELDYTRGTLNQGQRSVWSLHWVQSNPKPLWRPFFLIGLGLSSADHGSGALASVGFGGRWELLPGRLDLRADLRYRYNEGAPRGARNEGLLLVGIGIPLGSP